MSFEYTFGLCGAHIGRHCYYQSAKQTRYSWLLESTGIFEHARIPASGYSCTGTIALWLLTLIATYHDRAVLSPHVVLQLDISYLNDIFQIRHVNQVGFG